MIWYSNFLLIYYSFTIFVFPVSCISHFQNTHPIWGFSLAQWALGWCFTMDRLLAWSTNPPPLSRLGTSTATTELLNQTTAGKVLLNFKQFNWDLINEEIKKHWVHSLDSDKISIPLECLGSKSFLSDQESKHTSYSHPYLYNIMKTKNVSIYSNVNIALKTCLFP